jgi:glycosyltransferase involved in cell wall biosynthesis
MAYISYDSGFLSIHSNEIIANFIKIGVKVDLFMPDNVRMHAKLHDECNVQKIPIIFSSTILSSISYQIILSIFFLAEVLKNNRPDMIYARQTYSGIIPVLLAKMFRIPYFAEMNSITKKPEYWPPDVKLLLKCFLEWLCLKIANIIIAPSMTLKKRIIERYKVFPNKLHVVHNGVNDELFYPRENTKNLKKALDIGNKDFVVGFVGSMGKWQGIEIFKKAIKLTVAENEEIKFLIVGDYIKDSNLAKIKAGFGEGKKNTINFIKANFLESRVVYHSYVSYEESADYMNICNVLVAPYIRSAVEYGGGSPIKLYAYLGCRKAVIISDLGEFTDSMMLKKYGAAFMVAPDDSRALTDAIISLQKNRKMREKLGNNGRNFVLAKRKWFHSCSKMKSIYESKFGN